MGDQEFPVGGIPAEAKAYVVKQSAAVHLFQGVSGHFQACLVTPALIAGQQKQNIVGRRELGRETKAAVHGIIGAAVQGDGGFDQVFGRFVGRCLRCLTIASAFCISSVRSLSHMS